MKPYSFSQIYLTAYVFGSVEALTMVAIIAGDLTPVVNFMRLEALWLLSALCHFWLLIQIHACCRKLLCLFNFLPVEGLKPAAHESYVLS